ncbi:beta-glucosidase family protein [Streptomyces heilongjiangensis]|uniref:Beta-glucosidase n=1 Tax=Streptomyces heilongjiangensis TaxID=945052 RepID=A0ABW1BKA2_9ACTN|nr:glycoside hydrolase family 3 C-terminal domain-containing protein [Streptomyces heilongjiangensis]MDC2951952.1 glycoside hydrolase family 3 C-terminal domain-containing protein [Streptomyces heilongjiangensis]
MTAAAPEPTETLRQLSLGRRAGLTAGETGWSTRAAPEIGLSPMLLGDGPLGLVSPTFDERETAFLLPCGTALGATWDPDVVRAVGLVQGSQALRRGYGGVYAPNLNLARTGLSGRTFEMYSEDPLLAGVLGAALVRGLQSQGVAACPKHLVCNDTETERQRMNATVDEATLREMYLRPFEMAVEGGAWMLMTAYNGVNGVPCAAHADLLRIVKEEWGFDGLVLSDYFALKDTVGPALAGLDLEMPGPAIFFGERLAAAVDDGSVPEERLDDAVARLLRLAGRTGALAGTERRVTAPDEHVGEDRAPAVLATAAAASATLVRNRGGLLPLDPGALDRLAVIGPNAVRPTFQGATFGRVRPAGEVTTPAQAVRDRFGPHCDVRVEAGVVRTLPETLAGFRVTTPDGEPGVLLEHFRGDATRPVLTETRVDSAFVWFGTVPGAGPTTQPGRLRLTAVLTPEAGGRYTVGGGGSGETTVRVDGALVAHRPAPAPADVMGQVARAGMSTGEVELTAGVPVEVTVEMTSAGSRVQALTVGCLPPQPEDALDRAVRAATAADAAVVVVGDVLETARESRDLPSSALPDEQVRLIRAVAAANPRTVVVVNAGRPVDAPWADDVAAVLYAWLPGQEFGPALAAVLSGDAEPAGRMPVTVTCRDEDRSTWGERLDTDLALDYTATEPTGYRHLWRTGTAPRFAFGSGLGYTTWELRAARVERGADGVAVVATVANTGPRPGREVVQVYAQAPGESDARLAGFAGVRLAPTKCAEVRVRLDERAFSRWDTAGSAWTIPAGTHRLLVGRSSVELPFALDVVP